MITPILEEELEKINTIERSRNKIINNNFSVIAQYDTLTASLEKQKKESKVVIAKLFKDGNIEECDVTHKETRCKVFTRKTSVLDPADTIVQIGIDNYVKVSKVDSKQLKMDFPEEFDKIKSEDKIAVTVKL